MPEPHYQARIVRHDPEVVRSELSALGFRDVKPDDPLLIDEVFVKIPAVLEEDADRLRALAEPLGAVLAIPQALGPDDVLLRIRSRALEELARQLIGGKTGPRNPLGQALLKALAGYRRRAYRWVHKRGSLELPGPRLMGILNITPDSFSDGGRFLDPEAAIAQGKRLAQAGAAVIDIGGESTRPGAREVPEKEEIARVVPVIEALAAAASVPISIDTRKAAVAARAIEAGASIINDVSGLRHDPDLVKVAAETGAAVVIMHMLGTPADMQKDPRYDDLVTEVGQFLAESAALAEQAGIPADRIAIDPGIGFGKRQEHNLEILRRLDEFRSLGYPIVVGPSRKSFIGNIVGRPPESRLFGTAAAVALAVDRGASLIRVHDVAEMQDVVLVSKAILG